MEIKNEEGLVRAIGTKALAANVINLTIGAGIFVLPARVSESLGSSSIFAYLICGALIFIIMMCFAELGSTVNKSGGSYAYVESAFGPYTGFVISNLYWVGFGLISDAAIVNALLEMLSVYFPSLNSLLFRALFFFCIFSFLAIVNIRGVAKGATLVEFNTYAKLLPLLIILVFGWSKVQATNLVFAEWPSFTNLGEASLILFFAFGGAEAALTVGGEIKNPRKTVPIGLLSGILVVIMVYIMVQLIAQGVLGENLQLNKAAPLAAVAEILFGTLGPILILLGSGVAIFGALSGDILAMPRFLFAASKDKLFPAPLSQIHPVFKTPHYSIGVYSFLAFVLSLSGSFKQLAILSSSAILITYLFVILSMLKLRASNDAHRAGFRVPAGKLLSTISLCIIFWFLFHLSTNEIVAILLFLFVASLFYYRNIISKGFAEKLGFGKDKN